MPIIGQKVLESNLPAGYILDCSPLLLCACVRGNEGLANFSLYGAFLSHAMYTYGSMNQYTFDDGERMQISL